MYLYYPLIVLVDFFNWSVVRVRAIPNMSQLLQLYSGSTSSTISYYGHMNFLDDQSTFTTVFGIKPRIYGHCPHWSDNGSTEDDLSDYTEKFMFDVCLSICHRVT